MMNKITQNFELEKIDASEHKIYCKVCSSSTSHSIAASFKENGQEEHGSFGIVQWTALNQIIQCKGCKTVSFRVVSTHSEDVEYDHRGEYYPENIQYFPGRSEGINSIESHLLPDQIERIYQETILSIENDLPILAGVGIRAIIETICKHLKVKGNNLDEKINSLKEKAIITPDSADTLHKLRVLGNKAAHDVKAHNSSQLEVAMKIIEHMLNATYILPERVDEAFPKK